MTKISVFYYTVVYLIQDTMWQQRRFCFGQMYIIMIILTDVVYGLRAHACFSEGL